MQQSIATSCDVYQLKLTNRHQQQYCHCHHHHHQHWKWQDEAGEDKMKKKNYTTHTKHSILKPFLKHISTKISFGILSASREEDGERSEKIY